MDLVERSALLGQLDAFLSEARSGLGSVVLLGGDAGVGKTSLARAFLTRVPGSERVLWGSCEPLVTPEPLGPFHDMGPIASAIAAGPGRVALLRMLLAELATPPTTVMVIDDAHWADDATLDAIRFLGRRVHTTTGLLLIAYREDEVHGASPLRAVLGDLATAPGSRHLRVAPLSVEAVSDLAVGHALDAGRLHAVTGGNPFYVTEVLAAAGWTVPPTVTDAVLARVSRLEPDARRVLEVVSLAPGGLEPAIAVEMSGEEVPALDACLERGVLVMAQERVAFRHELARLAVEGSLPSSRRRRLHRQLVDRLERLDVVDAARLAHHAEAAGDAAAVLKYAPVAAREASQRGAHRAAAEHLGRAVARAGSATPTLLADLLSAWADERKLFDDPKEVLALRERTVELRRQTDDPRGVGRELIELGRMHSRVGDTTGAMRFGAQAIQVLERLPPSPELATAYAFVAFGVTEGYQVDDAIRRASEVIEFAESVGAPTATITALRLRGQAEIQAGRTNDGLESYEQARRLALAVGDHEGALAVAVSAGNDLAAMRLYDEATTRLQDAIEFGRAIDLDFFVGGAEGGLASIQFERGFWSEAEERAARLLAEQHRYPEARVTALTIRGRIEVRRGEPGAASTFDEAALVAEGGEPWHQWVLAAGRAEAAWLSGRTVEIPRIIGALYQEVREMGLRWDAGELGFWLWRAGALPDPPTDVAEPFALQMAGDWRGAAAAWERLGCPYEQAEALADGDEPAMREALGIYARLGAEPAGNVVRARMRQAGITHVPARPHRSTRAAPAQLTGRQFEILLLLEGGLTNAEIGERLFITEKTAGHHVSAILAKLGARSRTEAASTARKMGIVASET